MDIIYICAQHGDCTASTKIISCELFEMDPVEISQLQYILVFCTLVSNILTKFICISMG